MRENTDMGVNLMDNYAKLGSKNLDLVHFCLAIALWGLWTTRNKCAIEEAFQLNFCSK